METRSRVRDSREIERKRKREERHIIIAIQIDR